MLSSGAKAFAQGGDYISYTPYSIYGIGNLEQQGTPYNAAMGGVGIASRNNRYLNILNPAAITARDTLSVMMEFSLRNSNSIFSQNYDGVSHKSVFNGTNMGTIAMSFPIWRSLTAMGGITPYSSGGYNYRVKETNPAVIGHTGTITYDDYGQGSFYRLFGALGGMIGKRLSLGAEGGFLFGNYDKYFTQTFSKTGYNSAQDSYKLHLNTWTGRFGLQYEQPLGTKTKLGFGATYALASRLHGTMDYRHQSAGSAETVDIGSKSYSLDTLRGASAVRLGSELGLGISLNREEKLRLELDYILSDWRSSGMDTSPGFSISDGKLAFSSGIRHSVRAGMEFTPDRFSVRSFSKRISYRAGTYWNNEYYKVAGNEIHNFGITFGATLPIYVKGLVNGISISADLGQRGTMNNALVRERYFKVGVGVNLHDIWFIKPRYE